MIDAIKSSAQDYKELSMFMETLLPGRDGSVQRTITVDPIAYREILKQYNAINGGRLLPALKGSGYKLGIKYYYKSGESEVFKIVPKSEGVI